MTMGFQAGDLFGRYQILRKIGGGGMGEVFLAEESTLGRKVALKFLNRDISRDEGKIRRFFQEARAASTLNHPNIITVYEVGEADGTHYIAAEWVDGQTLREFLGGRSEHDLKKLIDVSLQIISALQKAHEAGIIHRDIKPDNIMIREDGLVKVLDFGLAKLSSLISESADQTMQQVNTDSGIVVGTVAYMSPEQARGRKVDTRSDIFSLGIVLFETFCGRRPFIGETTLELVSSILRDEPPPVRSIQPDLPQELEHMISRTLKKDPDLRYQSIKDLYLDLDDLKDNLKRHSGTGDLPFRTQTLPAQTANNTVQRSNLTTLFTDTRRFTLLHASVFILLACLAIGGIWYLGRGGGTPAFRTDAKVAELTSWVSAAGENSSNAHFSPDGKMIAFDSTRSGSKKIWIMQTANPVPLQITNDEHSSIDPVWSSKGDEIAYISLRQNAERTKASVWRISSLGGTPRLVAELPDASSKLRRWTDSGRIYYQNAGELHFVNLTSGNTEKVTSFGERRPSWISISSDEKTIGFSENNDSGWRIGTSHIDQVKEVVTASGNGKIMGDVAWVSEKGLFFYTATVDKATRTYVVRSGDKQGSSLGGAGDQDFVIDADTTGNSLLLGSLREESNLWRVNVVSGEETSLARDINAKLWPAISNDSRRLVYQSIKGLNAGNRIMDGNIVSRELDSSGDNSEPVTVSENGFLPTWSPDGSTVAFLRPASNQLDLFLVNSAGGAERRIATNIPPVGYSTSPYNLVVTQVYAWSPDGSSIAFIRNFGGFYNLWSTESGSGLEKQLTANSDNALIMRCPIYSPNGKQIAFYSERKREDGRFARAFNTVDLANGIMRKVYEGTDAIRLLGWSADSGSLVFAKPSESAGLPAETVVATLTSEGEKEAEVAVLKNVYYYNVFLSRDSSQIAYAARTKDLDNIWVMPLKGGPSRKVTSNNDPGQYVSRLAWLPDGTSIVFAKQTRFSLLSIMNNTD
jgi:eukaryotic-like serine/threonine-protein kinase